MSWFARKVQPAVSVRPAAIEGLEGRWLLSGSGPSMGPAMPANNRGPSVNMPQQNPNSGKNAAAIVEVKGIVTTVDVAGSKITIADEHTGALTTFTIPTTATVTVKDSTGGLAAIKTGVEVKIDTSNGAVVSVAADNKAKENDNDNNEDAGNKLEGTVTAVGANTLTVRPEHATAPVVLTIPTTAKITLNGTPATLAQITAGTFVEVHFAADGVTVVEVEVVSAGA